MVRPADNNKVLQTSHDVELIVLEEPQVARSQVAPCRNFVRAAGQNGVKRLLRRFGKAPVALGNTRTRYPDFADSARRRLDACVRIDDPHSYLRVQNRGRARLFLDELWRRFPDGPWAVKAQLLVAEIATSNRRWSEVLQACQVLSRIRPRDPANRRCVGLSRAARRMLQVGPKPAKNAQRWSWEHPLPQGNALNDVWVNPGKQDLVIAVGEAGTILQAGRAGRFKVVASPTRWALNAITGSTITSVYAVGAAGVAVHYDGAKWTVVRPASPGQPDLWGAFSAGAGRLVAVGDRGEVVTLSGGRWTRGKAATVTLRAVWGDGGDLFAVGAGGMLLRNSGGSWRLIRSDSYEDLWGIWGVSANNVIAVGNRKTVVHYNGKKAKEEVVGRNHFRDAWGTSAEEAWAVGTKGEIIRYSGGSWRGERTGCLVDLFGVAGRSSRSIWAVGDGGTILHRRGKRWGLVAGGLQQKLVAVIPGPAAGEGHALGERGALMRRNRKGRWKIVDTLPLLGRYRDVWSDGRRWIAVGDRGLMVLKTGKKWIQIKTNTPEDLQAVWGWDGGAVAVGTRGNVIRLQGNKASRQMTPTGLDLRDVWGAGPRSLVAVGHRGVVLRFDGERWTRVAYRCAGRSARGVERRLRHDLGRWQRWRDHQPLRGAELEAPHQPDLTDTGGDLGQRHREPLRRE